MFSRLRLLCACYPEGPVVLQSYASHFTSLRSVRSDRRRLMFYAGVFVCVDIAYNIFEREVCRRERHAIVRACTAHGQTPIACCPRELHYRHAGCLCRTAPRFRSNLRSLDPPPAARCLWHSAVTPHKSMTTSRIGCEQQTRALPSAGCSSGSGP